ncbi:beta-mannosidase, partial [Phenoliferia sp. Uapishka_3]
MLTFDLTSPSSWTYQKSPHPPLTSPSQVLAALNLAESDSWTPCTQMPSQIHVELLAAGRIPDPFKKMHEEVSLRLVRLQTTLGARADMVQWTLQDVQWVGEEDWVYKAQFIIPERLKSCSDLVFEGLDTFAVVFLNGKEMMSAENMFRTYRVDVSSHLLKAGHINTLEIVFRSAFIKGRLLEEEHLGKGKHNALWNGDASRLWVRKAGYNYGWDWGPVLMTGNPQPGPWRPIRLDSYTARLTDFWPRVRLNSSLEAVIYLTTSTSSAGPCHVNYSLLDPTGSAIRKKSVSMGTIHDSNEVAEWKFEKGEVELWWSVGLGKQTMYEVVADLDSFLTNVTEKRYRDWLTLLVEGGQNMVRSWGGGVYEDDAFFNICAYSFGRQVEQPLAPSLKTDLVAPQDFAFGCGQYPAHSEFVANVKAEAEDNVTRIRHHPCLAIFAGNNEDYQVAETMGLEYDPDDTTGKSFPSISQFEKALNDLSKLLKGEWTKTTFPAREIYERTLPEVVHRLSDVFYHPGSPWGGKDTRDPTVGDIHQWNVWHGTQEPYQHWDQLGGRFISEFGMQGYPDLRTIDYWLDGNSKERFPQSETMAHHNKAAGYERRQELYLIENIRHTFDLEGYAYATQLIQAETLSTAYRLWRREFKGPGKEYTAGALVWQLNDVYPCTSWSIVDYFLRPKPAYYTIKQSLAPIAVGLKRYTSRVYPREHSMANFIETHHVEAWAANSLLSEKKVEVIFEAFELLTGKRIWHKEVETTLGPNKSTEVRKFEVPVSKDGKDVAVVVCAKLRDLESGEVLSRFSSWPEPYKYLTFPDREATHLRIDRASDGQLKICASRPVKGLIFFTSSDNVKLSDNCLDLIPEDERFIEVQGLGSIDEIKWRCEQRSSLAKRHAS